MTLLFTHPIDLVLDDHPTKDCQSPSHEWCKIQTAPMVAMMTGQLHHHLDLIVTIITVVIMCELYAICRKMKPEKIR